MSDYDSLSKKIKPIIGNFEKLNSLFQKLTLDSDIALHSYVFLHLLNQVTPKPLSHENIESLNIVLVVKYLLFHKARGYSDEKLRILYKQSVDSIKENGFSWKGEFEADIFLNLQRGTYFKGTGTDSKHVLGRLTKIREDQDDLLSKKPDASNDTPELFAKNELLRKSKFILLTEKTNKEKKEQIFKLLDSVPDKFKVHQTYGNFFIYIKDLILTDSETKDRLDVKSEKDLLIEIVVRQLVLLRSVNPNGKEMAERQIKDYLSGKFAGMTDLEMEAVFLKLSKLSATKDKLAFTPTTKPKLKLTKFHKIIKIKNPGASLDSWLSEISSQLGVITVSQIGRGSKDPGYLRFLDELLKIKVLRLKKNNLIFDPKADVWKTIKANQDFTSLNLLYNAAIYEQSKLKKEEELSIEGELEERREDLRTMAIIGEYELQDKVAKRVYEEVKKYLDNWEDGQISISYKDKKFEWEGKPNEKIEDGTKLALNESDYEVLKIALARAQHNGSTVLYVYNDCLNNEYPFEGDADEDFTIADQFKSIPDLLETDPEEWVRAIIKERKDFAEEYKRILKISSSILSSLLEILDFTDPSNIILSPLGIKVFTKLGLAVKAIANGKVSYAVVCNIRISKREFLLQKIIQRWGKKSDKLIDIIKQKRKSAILRRNMKRATIALKKGDHAHHIIPSEAVLLSEKIQKAILDNNFNINDAINGMPLPAKFHRILHHEKNFKSYNEIVIKHLEGKLTSGKKITNGETIAEIKSLCATFLIEKGVSPSSSEFERIFLQ